METEWPYYKTDYSRNLSVLVAVSQFTALVQHLRQDSSMSFVGTRGLFFRTRVG